MKFTEHLLRIIKAQRMGLVAVQFYIAAKNRIDFCRFLTQRGFIYSFSELDKELVTVSWENNQ